MIGPGSNGFEYRGWYRLEMTHQEVNIEKGEDCSQCRDDSQKDLRSGRIRYHMKRKSKVKSCKAE